MHVYLLLNQKASTQFRKHLLEALENKDEPPLAKKLKVKEGT